LHVHTQTQAFLYNLHGYVFDGRIFLHQNGVHMVKVAKGTRPLVAKVADKDLRVEHDVSKLVHLEQKCPTVMQVEACFPVDTMNSRYALVTPFYGMTLDEVVRARSGFLPPVVMANVTLCTLSTIKAFTNVKLAHCDLKPQNLMMAPNGTVVAIDFGSASQIGKEITSTTASFAACASSYRASPEFDLSFLGTMLAVSARI